MKTKTPRVASQHKILAIAARQCLLVAALSWGGLAGIAYPGESRQTADVYRSPVAIAFSPDGQRLAASVASANEVVLLSVSESRVTARARLLCEPQDVAWSPDGRRVYVAQPRGRCVTEIDALSGAVARHIRVGLRPAGLAVSPQRDALLVSDEADDAVLAIDARSGARRLRIAAVRFPGAIALAPSGDIGVVVNRLPAGDASQPSAGAVVTLFEPVSGRKLADVALPAGSVNLRGATVSPDGRWAYVAHNLARAALPATQIEYGWINANALSIVDLRRQRHYATVLLDQAERGAANPWGVAAADDGAVLWIALSGVHRLARLDLTRLHSALAVQLPRVARRDAGRDDLPVSQYVTGERAPEVDDPSAVELVVGPKPSAYGMGLYLPNVIRRIDLPGLGLRGIAASPGEQKLAVAMHFSGSVALVDSRTGEVVQEVALGPQPSASPARRGEIAFHDARLCFQQWLSCATCHPHGRADGLNWDLMNDGAGNPKNTRSLVLSHRTGPMMSRGVRDSFSEAVAAGFQHILFRQAPPETRRDVEIYLRGLSPEPSPWLVDGQLSETARRGKAIFDDPQVGCARCHAGELLTDSRAHDVDTHVADDWQDENSFLTPKLVELWRTAPYLHHGQAATLYDVLTKYNPADRHGRTSHLGQSEIQALVEYLKSL
jgi:DNA-binding beta-propeller fold protein YncE